MRLNNDDKFQDFMTKYIDVISGKISELEKKRYILLFQDVFLSIFFSIVTFLILRTGGQAGVFISIIIMPLFPCVYTIKAINKYSQYIKENVLYNVLNECFNIKPITEKPDFSKSGLWPFGGYIIKTDVDFQGDWFEMTYRNLKCKVYEILVSNMIGNNRINYFKGVVIEFSNNKRLLGNVMIENKKELTFNLLHNNKLGVFNFIFIAIGIILMSVLPGSPFFFFKDFFENKMEAFIVLGALLISIFLIIKYVIIKRRLKVNMEMDEFKKFFTVYADYKFESETEVTPYLMQKLINFKNRFKHKMIRCSFYEDKVLLAINNGEDLFEIGNLLIPIYKSKSVYKFYRDINMLYDIMNYFFK